MRPSTGTDPWRREERAAKMRGWDFSHIAGRYKEEHDLPWDYREVVERYLRPEHRLLDLETGGGEFLLSLNHPHAHMSATEAYPPNVALCRRVLLPLGVDFRKARGDGPLPFEDGSFELVINRHGTFHPAELFRVLKPGGVFVTQQVGAENDRELVELLLSPPPPLPFPDQYLVQAAAAFRGAGFEIVEAAEAFGAIEFYDVGALVWFARIIEWEFPGFSVKRCLAQLSEAQRLLEENGKLAGRTHRFLLVAQKPQIESIDEKMK